MRLKSCFVIVALITLCKPLAYGQGYGIVVDVERLTRDRIYSGDGFTMDRVNDTLILENGEKCILKQSPLIFFDGYSKLFSDYKDVIVFVETGQKGFTCSWVIKNRNLYLDKIYFGDTPGDSLRSGTALPPLKVQRKKLEALTGQEFTSKNLLPAYWMSGAFGGFGFKKSTLTKDQLELDWDKEYIFYFDKGRLSKIKLCIKRLIDVPL